MKLPAQSNVNFDEVAFSAKAIYESIDSFVFSTETHLNVSLPSSFKTQHAFPSIFAVLALQSFLVFTIPGLFAHDSSVNDTSYLFTGQLKFAVSF